MLSGCLASPPWPPSSSRPEGHGHSLGHTGPTEHREGGRHRLGSLLPCESPASTDHPPPHAPSLSLPVTSGPLPARTQDSPAAPGKHKQRASAGSCPPATTTALLCLASRPSCAHDSLLFQAIPQLVPLWGSARSFRGMSAHSAGHPAFLGFQSPFPSHSAPRVRRPRNAHRREMRHETSASPPTAPRPRASPNTTQALRGSGPSSLNSKVSRVFHVSPGPEFCSCVLIIIELSHVEVTFSSEESS